MATHENWLSRRKDKHSRNLYKLDTNKSNEENIKDILRGLYLKKPFHNDISPTKKNMPTEVKTGLKSMQRSSTESYSLCLSYLNALVTLLCKEDRNNLGFTTDELMTCIRVSLVDESMVIRATALRVLRYLIKTESDVATFNNLKLSYLVTRSMDLMLRNEDERAQALRVVRRIIAVVGPTGQVAQQPRGAYIDQGLLRCLAAVARAGSSGDGAGDRLSRPAVATLAEICVLNPDLFISCGGVTAVTRQLAECATPRMAEALCGVLLHTLNDPASRISARIDLTFLSSPYCDFHFRPAGTDSNRDEREMRFTCSRLALLCVLRSWPGLLHFCHPHSSGGLRALVAALYLPRLEVRKAILDLLYELVGLPQPEWTDEISVALDAVDPSDFQDSWRLNEGFVAAEGTAILPHLSATGPDITEIHLALLLQCFLEAGLLDGLAEVIVTSDTFISVRATVLLGQLLHLIHLFLPPQLCNITPALPLLMAQASAGKPQALAAVAALRRLHAMLEARPASSSLFLDHILQYCNGAFKERTEDSTKSRKEKDNANMAKPKQEITLQKESSIEFLNESDNENEPKQRHSVGSRADVANRNVSALVKSKSVSSRTSAAVSKVTKSAKFFNLFETDSDSLIRCSLVMQNKDGNTWDWEIIRTILKESESGHVLNLNESGHKAWAARIVSYLKPSSNKYSHADLSPAGHGHAATRAGCHLVRRLLAHRDADSQKLLEDLFMDVSRQIEAIETGTKAHGCLFSPQHMCNTMCQMYFLFIGQLCHSPNGLRLFKQTRLYENLLDLSTKTHHTCYVQLVISSLDYTLDSYPRDILAKTLTCGIQASRLYATQFLNVLLRASRKSRELVRRKSKLKKNIIQEHLKSNREDVDSYGVDMDTWILQMLVGQVKDDYKPVVKCALAILEEAYSVPTYFDKLITMKETLCQNCRLDKNMDPSTYDFSAVGDRGYLLWLGLEVAAASHTSDPKSMTFLKKHLEFWTKSYNYRYVRLVETGVHEALTLSEGGSRSAARARRPARPPPHLHAALVARPAPSAPSAASSASSAPSAAYCPSSSAAAVSSAPTSSSSAAYCPSSSAAAASSAPTSSSSAAYCPSSSAAAASSAPTSSSSAAAASSAPTSSSSAAYCPSSSAAAASSAPTSSSSAAYCPSSSAAAASSAPTSSSAASARPRAALLALVLPAHYKILQRKKCTSEQEIMDLKASLWAVGNTAVTAQGLQQLMSLSSGYLEDSVLIHILRLAKYSSAYSVRATAFYVLGLIGSTYDGANLLSELGWLCVRHTRHDQFPLIPDETYQSKNGNTGGSEYFVTSPERRYNYDNEISEHSDHTDQSIAESSNSDFTKHLCKVGSLLAEQPELSDQDVVDYKINFTIDGRREPDKRKSHTLPTQGCSSVLDRPMLSESKTIDILRDCPNYERQGVHRTENKLMIGRMNSLEHHEGRVRNTSESSTSGVSSCDSFFVKHAIPDRVLTLSPIPSSSSLYGMKSNSTSQRPKITELQRRTSASSFTGPDVASSPPSQLDITGYATLKSLNRHRRPHLSESAATGSSDLDDLSWLLSDSNRRSKPFSSLRDRAKSTRERMNKLSLLDYDWRPLRPGEAAEPDVTEAGQGGAAAGQGGAAAGQGGAAAGQGGGRGPRAPRRLPPPAPAYLGICLPRDLMDLFPRDDEIKESEESECKSTRRNRVPSFLVESSNASTENKSRATPDSQKLASYKDTAMMSFTGSRSAVTHAPISTVVNNTTSALTITADKCTKDKIGPSTTVNVVDTANICNINAAECTGKTSIDSAAINILETEKRIEGDGSIAGKCQGTSEDASIGTGRINRWRHSTSDCLVCVRTRPPSSHELREAFFAGMDSSIEIRSPPSSPVSEQSPYADVLHHVHFMSNPIHLRQARSALVSLKQRHPEVFRSACVYSDVSALLSADTYMLCARRFLQELFLDTTFECFATVPEQLLQRHQIES